jgi:hypothetical protein
MARKTAEKAKSKRGKLPSLIQKMNRLEKENLRLGKELIEKRRRRIENPAIVPGESLVEMARLNLKITEAEAMIASQRNGIHGILGFITLHENRVGELDMRLKEMEKMDPKEATTDREALKREIHGILSELKALREKRERLMTVKAV